MEAFVHSEGLWNVLGNIWHASRWLVIMVKSSCKTFWYLIKLFRCETFCIQFFLFQKGKFCFDQTNGNIADLVFAWKVTTQLSLSTLSIIVQPQNCTKILFVTMHPHWEFPLITLLAFHCNPSFAFLIIYSSFRRFVNMFNDHLMRSRSTPVRCKLLGCHWLYL